ncbi:MAG: IgGFc-binding protein [Chlorobi bacterium]|nr:IgGFc-binding protein [Chlorobiota bacterium]
MSTALVVWILSWVCIAGTASFAISPPDTLQGRYRTINSEGTEFWLCFMKNFREQDPNKPGSYEPAQLEVFITAAEDADVTMEISGLTFRHRMHVPAGTIRSVRITPEAELDTSARVQMRALYIKSTAPIAVYALNHRVQTTDTYLALPTSVLGTEYRAMCYSKLSATLTPQFAIVATEDDTRIDITPTTPTTDGHRAYEQYSITLDRGQVYQVRAQFYASGTGDLTGTLIKSTKPIAVFSGHTCAYVPPGVTACNHLVEQLPPVRAWGKHYYVGKLRGRSRYTYRILAAENGTRVFRNQTLIAVLNAGEYYEEPNATDHVQITADKPILIAQYSQGYGNGDQIGDPMMILISPTQQFVRQYRIATPVQGSWDHYVNIVAREDAIGSIRVDGRPLPRSLFERIGITSYFVAQIPLDYGSHMITGDEPFGLYSYGFGYRYDAYDAYGTMGGQSFLILDTLVDRIPPQSTFQLKSTGKALRVTVRDDRPADQGLDSIIVLAAQNLRAYLPRIERGQPQAEFDVHPLDPEQDGQLTLVFSDVAGNRATATYTYCYDPKQHRFEFVQASYCPPQWQWQAELTGIATALYHTAAFQASGGMSFERPTGNVYGAALSIGAAITHAVVDRLRLYGRITVEPYGRPLSAPDSLTSSFRLPNDSLITVQAETLLMPTTPAFAVGVGVEWTTLAASVNTHTYELYLHGGIRALVQPSQSVSMERRFVLPSSIPTPPPFASRTHQTLSSLRTFQAEVLGGFGILAPLPMLSSRWSLCFSTQYAYPLGSILTDASWTIERLQVLLGIRYSF